MKSIRTLTLTVVLGLLLAVALASYAVNEWVAYRRFAAIEEADIRRDLRVVKGMLETRAEDMLRLGRDWACWTDTVRFIRFEQPQYVEDNLGPQTFRDQGLSHIVFMARNGMQVWGGSLAGNVVRPYALSHDTARRLAVALAPMGDTDRGLAGFLRLEGKLVLMAVLPALHTDHSGPSPGWMLMARLPGEDLEKSLSGQFGSELIFMPVGDPAQPPSPEERRSDAGGILTSHDGDTISGSMVLPDIFGAPVLRVTMSRVSAWRASVSAIHASYLAVLTIGVAVLLWFLEKKVLSRVATLDHRVRAIRDGTGDIRSVRIGGDDELSRLGQTIAEAFAARLKSEERYSVLFHHTGSATILVAEDTGIVLANEEFLRLARISAEDLAERPSWTRFVLPRELPRILEYHNQRRQDPAQAPRNYETVFRDREGRTRDVYMTVGMIPGTGLSIASILDISGMKAAEERLRRQAFTDDLTGLPNRQHFSIRLEHAIETSGRGGRKLGIMLLDLDEFKDINDSMGHQVGDEVLRLVAKRLRETLRRSDTLARLGGDEFTMLVEDVNDTDDLAELARKILDVLAPPFLVAGMEIFIGVSIGLSLYPSDGDTPERLLQCADLAMYRSKSLGKNTFSYYTSDLNSQALHRLQMEARIRGALDEGGVVPYFQPVYSLEDGTICGFEALARCRDVDGRTPDTAEFISVAERTGLIVAIEELILDEACAWCAKLNEKEGASLSVAVNISARHFLRGNLVQEVIKALETSGLPPWLLEIEITETAAMENLDYARRTIAALSVIGVRLSLDDFGTGYSSLSYLRHLHVQKLKIDRSFVVRFDTPDGAALLRAIVDLALSLGLTPVAEGVETEEQVAFLLSIGCRLAQGWLFSRALPADEAAALLSERSVA